MNNISAEPCQLKSYPNLPVDGSLADIRGLPTSPIADPPYSPLADRPFCVTFGKKMQQAKGTWTDQQVLTWAELARVLTDHKEGPKDGPCIVPAILRQPERKAEYAEEIGTFFLDSDCGHTLSEIEAPVRRHGLAACVYSTHSHMTTRTTIARSEFKERGLTAEQYLIQVKKYLPRVAAGAKVLQGSGNEVTLEHQPCPKFRVVLRLDRPWRALDYPDQRVANEAWRDRYRAAAHHLGLSVDPACSDPNRLFFLPRHAPRAAFDTRIIEGADLPIWDLPAAPQDPSPATPSEPAARRENVCGDDSDVIGAFNRAFTVESQLEKYGYKKIGIKWLAPTSSTKGPGVSIKDDRAFSHHGSDPLFTGDSKHSHDAFSVFRLWEHGGDLKQAVKAAARLLNIKPNRSESGGIGHCTDPVWPEGYTKEPPGIGDENGQQSPTDHSKLEQREAEQSVKGKTSGPGASEESPPCFEDAILEDWKFIALNIPEKQTFLSPWLTEQSISLIAGWRGVGKTWFAMLVLDAVTKGIPFGPWQYGISAPCLYLDGEMPVPDVIERIEAIGTGGRKHPLHVFSAAYASILGLGRINLLDEKCRAGLKDDLLKKQVKLWVVDNLASLTPGIDENSKQDWDPINRWLLELRFAGISTILLHHEGKEGQQRGTSAREDNIDISIALQKPANYSPEDGARFITHFTKHRIRTRDLALIADTEFQVRQGMADGASYTWGNVKKQNREQVIEMLGNGVEPKDIIEALHISRGRVSQIKAEAISSGFMTPKGKLTQLYYQQGKN